MKIYTCILKFWCLISEVIWFSYNVQKKQTDFVFIDIYRKLIENFDSTRSEILFKSDFFSVKILIFSSPEPKAHWWAYCIGRPPLSSTLFKHHHLRNHWANRSQISYGASMGWGNESVQMVLVTWPRWPPCSYMVKTFKNLLQSRIAMSLRLSIYSIGQSRVLPSLFKWWPQVDLWPFYAKVEFGSLCFCMGKHHNRWFLRNFRSLWFRSWYVGWSINLWINAIN